MKKVVEFLLLGVLFSLMSCGIKEEKTALGCTEEQYQINVENSLYSLGNNYRTKKVLEKLTNGETVYVAAIGGSVTEGAGPRDSKGNELWKLGYAFKFRDMLKEKYPEATILFDGAGLSGTPSALGVMRYEKDVLQTRGLSPFDPQADDRGLSPLSQLTPDILIIEFSVNDNEECTQTRGFERIIRWAQEANPNALVIALYAHATYQNSQASMIPVADFYKIPQVSIRNALENKNCGVDLKQEGAFFSDYVHPTEAGHIFMAECLMNVLTVTENAEIDEEYPIPSEFKNQNPFKDFHAVYPNTEDSNITLTSGSFSQKDANTQGIKKGGTEFPENWNHTADSGNESWKVELNCKTFIMAYKHQSSMLAKTIPFGSAEVYVDGKLTATYQGDSPNGWNDCVTVKVLDESQAADHVIEIKMAKESENKGFTILCFGYSK